MKGFKSLKCLLILYALCFMSSGYYGQSLGLLEGAICNENGICKPLINCTSAVEGLKNNIRPIICSTKGSNSTPIVCCPQSNGTKINPKPSSAVKTYSASENAICNENHICMPLMNCASALQGLKINIRPIICSTKGSNSTPIVCCPRSNGPKKNPQPSSDVKTNSAIENAICNENHICMPLMNCASALQGLQKNIRPIACSIKGSNSTPMVCCPQSNGTKINPQPLSAVKTYSASEMCEKYSNLIWRTEYDPILMGALTTKKVKDCIDVKTLILGGEKAEPKEFPHMALLGIEEKPSEIIWLCGGSLISNRWILSAAHCENNGVLGCARLGEINYNSDDDSAQPVDYKIIDRKIHPEYNAINSRYNDIALFKLDKDVEFSPYIRPICLNVESSINETKGIASGWGRLGVDGQLSERLLKVTLGIHSINKCIKTYITDSSEADRKKLPQGITKNSQMCVGDMSGEKDTCGGDSGGPFQIVNSKYECMYTQIGITSFGKPCGSKNAPAIYTRVSYYIPWIEQIVWPKN